MKMKKLITSIMIILISMTCMVNYSYAAGEQLEATIEITPSASKVTAGNTVTFTFITKNIVNAESGKIFAIGGKMVYDTAFFELDTTSGITLSEETGLFNSTNAVSEGGTNGTITLKVKTDATGSGVVTFSELEASDGRLEDMETLGMAITEDQSFTITIDAGTGDEQDPPADDGTGDEQDPPADDGTGDEQDPPADDGTGDEQDPPVDDGTGDDASGDEECSHSYQIKNDGTYHWEECTKCKEQKTGIKESHNYGEYKDNGNGTHTATCTVCGYKLTENHNNNGGTCKYCNAVISGTGSGNNNDTTIVDKEIPKAGLSAILVVGMVAVVIVAVVMYRKNQKYQDIK